MRKRSGTSQILRTVRIGAGCAFLAFAGCEPDGDPHTILQVLRGSSEFTTLLSAVEIAGLTGTLESDGSFTLLAPDNAAFDKLDAAERDALFADPVTLRNRLQYHLLDGRETEAEFRDQSVLIAVQDGAIEVSVEEDGTITLDGAQILKANEDTANGIVHTIDPLLEP
ncbi:MAG: fasciclin domain-containing protein [Verrucomicrobia bacterium]|nr:fasciclin domain-containing protein [Verrucomicrobiota bacterium]